MGLKKFDLLVGDKFNQGCAWQRIAILHPLALTCHHFRSPWLSGFEPAELRINVLNPSDKSSTRDAVTQPAQRYNSWVMDTSSLQRLGEPDFCSLAQLLIRQACQETCMALKTQGASTWSLLHAQARWQCCNGRISHVTYNHPRRKLP